MIRRCIIFCILGIHLFLHFNQVKKNQLLLNEVVNITDAKKENWPAKFGRIWEEEKYIFSMQSHYAWLWHFFFKLMEFFFFSLVNTIHSALCLILLLLLALVYLPVETEHLRSIEILDEIFNLVEDYHLSLYLILCDLFILLCYIKKKNYFGSQKYILKSKIPLTVAVTVILSACHSGGPHRNNGENYQCFSR